MANGIYRRSGSLLVILLGTAWVAPASVARFTTTPGQPSATVPGRTTEDRADDTTGYQIHALYVLPSDAEDEHLDSKGIIAASWDTAQNWLADQTGGRRFRSDTFQGALDVTFVRLSRTDAQLSAYGNNTYAQIDTELLGLGFAQPNKLYAAFYGGSHKYSCGNGALPPNILSNLAVVYLHGLPSASVPCDTYGLSGYGNPAGYFEFGILHEIVHTLGFVPKCAPHVTGSSDPGHVSDDPHDLMYSGPLTWEPSVLDAARDDYFEHSHPGCLDLAKSTFLQPPTADAAPPPGWPIQYLDSLDCSREPQFRTHEARTKSSIDFVNSTGQPRKIYWLDARGKRQFIFTLQPWNSGLLDVYLTYPFVVTDSQGQCQAIYLSTAKRAEAIIRN